MTTTARLRQLLISIALVAVVFLLAGATYQGVATAVERRRYPHPGQLLDVGGHQLHIHCVGDGDPTVILESGVAEMSASWGLVQPAVAGTARTCAYDRAGLGWSEAGDRPFDPARVPDELRALLHAAKIEGPYVLAGHSLGSAFARIFAARYPADVAGLVLIDPPSGPASERPVFALSPWLARAGLLRLSRGAAGTQTGLPEPAAGAYYSFLNRPDHLARAAQETARWGQAVRLAADAAAPPVPLATVRLDEAGGRGSLGTEAGARRVAAAIRTVVTRARAN